MAVFHTLHNYLSGLRRAPIRRHETASPPLFSDAAPVQSSNWHPHFGQITDTSLNVWLARFAAVPATWSLVLATDERTGSELLCQLLGQTGRLGRPSEYLNCGWMRRFIHDYPDDIQEQLSIAHHVGTTPNGCFSMKLHPWHIDLLSTAEGAVAAAFPSPRFVRLIRQDLLGQAISLLRARQTGSYHSHIQEEKPATYDANAIDGIIRDLSRNRARWDMYFARIGVIPLLVTYEELCTDTFGVLTRIATFMGETVHHKDLVGMLPIRKQANSQSWEWRERYVRERGDINYLDRM